ncbi:Hypothetical protein BRZCDTV_73 [Brazilian cedratvirus IHUMI]|uniref:Uncharacterized protein n=1 Tax=Brazilian cedratvirus IHUMI TaxID=2126980 RepID=A0A2R8FD57_9VIRU|nr:Hypothetical protein BRZCDTV_73 [Brazilian cedratvirus IHUMI]
MSFHMFTDDGLEKKKCSKCKEWQLLACFNKERSRRDGLCSRCRHCQNKYRRLQTEKKKKQSSLFLSKTTCLAQSLLFQAYYGFETKEEDLSFDSLVKTILVSSRTDG